MVRLGGSASRTIGDQGSTDPGGGGGRRPPSWQLPVGCGLGSHRNCRASCPAFTRTRFLAVAEGYSLAFDIEGVPSIISTDGQWSAVVLDPIVATRQGGGLMKERSVLEPLEHSVLGLSQEGGEIYRDEVVGLHPLEHLGVDRSADLMEGTSSLGLLEHSVPKVPLDEGGQLTGSKTVSDPLERAGASNVGNCCPLPVRQRTRREPEMEDIECGTLEGWMALFRTSTRRPTGFPWKKGKQLSWGHHGFCS